MSRIFSLTKNKVSLFFVLFVAVLLVVLTTTGHFKKEYTQAATSDNKSLQLLGGDNFNPCNQTISTQNGISLDPSNTTIPTHKLLTLNAADHHVYNLPLATTFPSAKNNPQQVYTFQVCVKSYAMTKKVDPPNVYVGYNQAGHSTSPTEGNVQFQKALGNYSTNGSWTLYRTIFYLGDVNNQNLPLYITLEAPGSAKGDFLNPSLYKGVLPAISGAIVSTPGADILKGIGWFENGFGSGWTGLNTQTPTPKGSGPTTVDVSKTKNPESIMPSYAPAGDTYVAQLNYPGDQMSTTANYNGSVNSCSTVHNCSQYSPIYYNLTYWIRMVDENGDPQSYPTNNGNLCTSLNQGPTKPAPGAATVQLIDNNDNGSLKVPPTNVYQQLNPPGAGKWHQCQYSFWYINCLPNFPQIQASWYFGKGVNPSPGYHFQVTGITLDQLNVIPPTSDSYITPSNQALVSNFTTFFSNPVHKKLSQMKMPNGQVQWLLPRRAIGDLSMVLPGNLELINAPALPNSSSDPSKKGDPKIIGKPVLRLRYFGGDDSVGMQDTAGIQTDNPYAIERSGSGIVSNPYYASAIYVHCVRLPYDPYNLPQPGRKSTDRGAKGYSENNTGVVSAFWPYFAQDLFPGSMNYNNEGGTKRNSELDWEIPGAAEYNAVCTKPPCASNGSFFGNMSYDYARLNTWGGQWSGDGNDLTARPPLVGSPGSLQSIAGIPYSQKSGPAINKPLNSGQFIQISYVIDGGGARQLDPSQSNYLSQVREPGQVAWYLNGKCELLDEMGTTPQSQINNDWLTEHILGGVKWSAMPPAGSLIDKIGATNVVLGTRVKLAQFNPPTVISTSEKGKKIIGGTITDSASVYTGATYGQDNIPYKPMRDWVALWTPGTWDHPDPSYNMNSLPKSGQIYMVYWGWAGTPDFLHELGSPQFQCSYYAQKLPGWSAWAKNRCAKADSSTGIDQTRAAFLKSMASMNNKSMKTASGINPAYLTYYPGPDFKGCDPSDPSVNPLLCFTNERDMDIASIVILPLPNRQYWENVKNQTPTKIIDYLDATNNYVCLNHVAGSPKNCNSTDLETYPTYQNVTPKPVALRTPQ